MQFGEDVMNEATEKSILQEHWALLRMGRSRQVTRRGLDNSATRNGEPLFTKEVQPYSYTWSSCSNSILVAC